MDELSRLAQAVRSDLPEAEVVLDPPAGATQAGWLDIHYQGKVIAVEWRQGRGFGVSLLAEEPAHPCSGLFEGPDQVFQGWQGARERILSLLAAADPQPRRLRAGR
jgi:hypothetical protein